MRMHPCVSGRLSCVFAARSAGIPGSILAKEALDLRDDGAGLARFGEISIASDLHRLLAIGGQRVRRERDDWNVACCRIVLQHLCGFPSVDDRNGYIHQDQIRLFGACFRNAFFTVQRLTHLITEMAQDGGIDDAVVLVVLDEKNGLSVASHAWPHRLSREWIDW